MNLIRYHTHRILNRYLLHGVRNSKDILAMHALAPLSHTYLPWSQTAMRPSAVAAVLNEVVVNRRRQVVELGGGVSTFYIGRLLRQVGGRLYTVEHDGGWAGLLERRLRFEGLDDVVAVVHAPLVPNTDGVTWYSADKLQHLRTEGGIDLLLVDGPPAYGYRPRQARYPAVPFFAGALAPSYTIVLDDIDRRGEQEILHRWEAQLGIRFERRFIHGTIAVGRPVPSFAI